MVPSIVDPLTALMGGGVGPHRPTAGLKGGGAALRLQGAWRVVDRHIQCQTEDRRTMTGAEVAALLGTETGTDEMAAWIPQPPV